MEYQENNINYCTNCGAALIHGGLFCKKCGRKVITEDSLDNDNQDGAKSSPPEETGLPAGENLEFAQHKLENGDIPMTAKEDRENGSFSEVPEKRKKHKKLLLVNIILSLVLIIGVVSFFLVNSRMKKEFREFVADYKKEMENLEFLGEYEEIHEENLDEADVLLNEIAFWKLSALEKKCDETYSQAKSFNDRMIASREEYENCLLDESDTNYSITSLDGYRSAKESAEKAFQDMNVDTYEYAVQNLSREKDAVCTKVSEYFEAKMAKLSSLKDSKEGDIIEFGNYYGNTEWIVLKREGDILTLLSKDCINQKPYNTEWEDVTWETCSLRKWLNEEYINEAFDGIEQQLIEETVIENPDNIYGYGSINTEGGNDTKDKIFLLSLEEVEEYFTDEDSRVAEYFGDTQGCWWWLRSPGYLSCDAADVNSDGSVAYFGGLVCRSDGAVRPAFHLNLSNLSNLELKPNLIGTNRKQRNVKQELIKIKNASVGEEVEYGSYLGNTTWKVLKKEEGKALLIAKDIVGYASYNNEEEEDDTWETCSLRTWLNDSYLNCTFNEEERHQIVKTYVENKDNPEYGTEGGPDTEDYVFLLSIEEAEEYFTDNESRQATNTDGEECWWWLRSPGGNYKRLAAGVDSYGILEYSGGEVIFDSGIRPALWVNLEF